MKHTPRKKLKQFRHALKNAFFGAMNSDTIYDDVMRSICERHLTLLIPLVNRSLGTHYTEDATIVLLNNEHHNTISNNLNLRVTDAYFRITENGISKNYHLECQSTGSSSMIVRIMEYDFLIAIDELASRIKAGKYENVLELPETVVLYLRHTKDMPDRFHVQIRYREQVLDYIAPIVKAQSFSLEELKNDELYVLLPFYLMRYEQQMKHGKDLDMIENEIEHLKELILSLEHDGRLNAYQAKELLDYIARILSRLTRNSRHRERMMRHMRGNVIYTKADKIYDKGYKSGHDDGFNAGFNDGHDAGFNDGFNDGHDAGFNDGFNDGHDAGFNDGFEGGIALTKAVFRLDNEGYALSDIAVKLSVSEEQVKKILEK